MTSYSFHRTCSSYAGTAAATTTALRVQACLQEEVAEGAGGKMEKKGNAITGRYIHTMKCVCN